MSRRMQVARSQEAVNDKLHMLEMHQKETHDSLLQMEKTASSMYQVWMQLMAFQS
jgi:peptidoglycan hydrolase CwlO-like protein